jgi:hypothetical protein
MRCATCGEEESAVTITITQDPTHREGGNIHEGMGPACAERWAHAPERNFYLQLLERQRDHASALRQYRDFQARVQREKARAA